MCKPTSASNCILIRMGIRALHTCIWLSQSSIWVQLGDIISELEQLKWCRIGLVSEGEIQPYM
jgi:hypothetical protein